MIRPIRFVSCVVAVVAGALVFRVPSMGAVGQDPAKPPLFRLVTDAVRVEVFVRTRDHRPVVGLTPADFEIFDNDIRQEIVDIVYGQIPIDITVALDVSFSVKGRMLEDLRRAIAQLMRDLGKEDRLRLILFNSRVNRAVDFTRDVEAVDRAISGVTAGGGTSVYDTLSVALVSASHPDRRQLVMCFTDGLDTNSTTGPEELIATAQRTRATLAFVMPPPPRVVAVSASNTTSRTTTTVRPASVHARDKLIDTLLLETGGSRFDAGSELTSTFRNVLNDFRSAYVIHFRPRGVTTGGFHPLTVSVKKSGATVLTRRGYFGG